MTYEELKNLEPKMGECFFAFDKGQFEIGKSKIPHGEKIFSAGDGLFGTKKGLDEMVAFFDNLCQRIAKECEPQEVYDYEFDNHECEYTRDDTEVYELLLSIYGSERAQIVKRRFGKKTQSPFRENHSHGI